MVEHVIARVKKYLIPFLWPNSVPWYVWVHCFGVSIHQVDVWIVSTSLLLKITLLMTFTHKSLCEHMSSLLWGRYLGVELLGCGKFMFNFFFFKPNFSKWLHQFACPQAMSESSCPNSISIAFFSAEWPPSTKFETSQEADFQNIMNCQHRWAIHPRDSAPSPNQKVLWSCY